MVKIACLNDAFSPIFRWVHLQFDNDLLKGKHVISGQAPCALKKTCYTYMDGNCFLFIYYNLMASKVIHTCTNNNINSHESEE